MWLTAFFANVGQSGRTDSWRNCDAAYPAHCCWPFRLLDDHQRHLSSASIIQSNQHHQTFVSLDLQAFEYANAKPTITLNMLHV